MTKLDKRPVALLILDGYGINENREGNAVKIAKTPYIDSLKANYPTASIRTSGMDVGLPRGQMGNSEVGHTNIGAGRIVYQELTRITKEIEDGPFFEKQEFLDAIGNCMQNGTSLHLFGLLSDGGVHSHNTHLYALIQLAADKGLKNVFIHCFYDGRDVPPDSGLGFTEELAGKIREIGTGRIATMMGRYYAMDRDNRWERVKRAYDAMVLGEGRTGEDPCEIMRESYKAGITDEFIAPTVLIEDGKPVARISAGDSVIFFNFRPDRAREITRAFVDPVFSGFNRARGFFPLHFVCMTQYDKTFAAFEAIRFAYLPENLSNTFGETVSRNGLTQLRIAETEKYAHVTFFFNGGLEEVYAGEDRALVPSPKVATYDLKPEMSAFEVADEAYRRVCSGKYDVIVLNFANCDMVGHTGILEAAVRAVETVDACVAKVAGAVLGNGGIVLLTADHGNAEQMIDPETHGPFTAHTTNPVVLILAGAGDVKLRDGRLADLAPTMLDLMHIEKPAEMTGASLISR
ncbi:MAG: 2,3-bisphosphoglycerate-independent phosphoglycerate mutase [Saccharofermentanales bacterium]